MGTVKGLYLSLQTFHCTHFSTGLFCVSLQNSTREAIRLIVQKPSFSDEMLGATKTNKNTTFRTVWGCLWLSDIERLRELAARISEDVDGSAGMLELFEQRKILKC